MSPSATSMSDFMTPSMWRTPASPRAATDHAHARPIEHGLRAERDHLDHVEPGADAAVGEHLDLVADRIDDVRERARRSKGPSRAGGRRGWRRRRRRRRRRRHGGRPRGRARPSPRAGRSSARGPRRCRPRSRSGRTARRPTRGRRRACARRGRPSRGCRRSAACRRPPPRGSSGGGRRGRARDAPSPSGTAAPDDGVARVAVAGSDDGEVDRQHEHRGADGTRRAPSGPRRRRGRASRTAGTRAASTSRRPPPRSLQIETVDSTNGHAGRARPPARPGPRRAARTSRRGRRARGSPGSSRRWPSTSTAWSRAETSRITTWRSSTCSRSATLARIVASSYAPPST